MRFRVRFWKQLQSTFVLKAWEAGGAIINTRPGHGGDHHGYAGAPLRAKVCWGGRFYLPPPLTPEVCCGGGSPTPLPTTTDHQRYAGGGVRTPPHI